MVTINDQVQNIVTHEIAIVIDVLHYTDPNGTKYHTIVVSVGGVESERHPANWLKI